MTTKHLFSLGVLPALMLLWTTNAASRRVGSPPAAHPRLAVAPGRKLTPTQFRQLLTQTNLGRLWQSSPHITHDEVMTGCFGYECQCIEIVFSSVRPVAGQPGRYVMEGKYMCYGKVTPFAGTANFTEIRRLANDEVGDWYGEPTKPVYGAAGRFALRPTHEVGIPGSMTGKIALSFRYNDNGRPELAQSDNPTTRQRQLLFEGEWRPSDQPGAKSTHVLLMTGMEAPSLILGDFLLGSRIGRSFVNSKYHALGWRDRMYRNDEWWNYGNMLPASPGNMNLDWE